MTRDQHDINFIALAGYLKKIPASVVDRFQGKITNIHPSLLPYYLLLGSIRGGYKDMNEPLTLLN